MQIWQIIYKDTQRGLIRLRGARAAAAGEHAAAAALCAAALCAVRAIRLPFLRAHAGRELVITTQPQRTQRTVYAPPAA